MASMAGMIQRVAIGDIIRRSALRYPLKIALVDGEKRISFQELNEASNRFANYLLSLGLNHGDRVSGICQNSMEYLIAIFGIAKAGLVWVPVNPALAIQDIVYIVNHSDTKVLISDDLFFAKIAPALPECVQVRHTISIPLTQSKPSIETSDFIEALKGQSALEPEVEIDAKDLALIMYTSGTTGKPKGVMQNHLSIYLATLGNIIEVEISKDDVTSCVLPLFHCGQHVLTTSALHIGATAVIMRGFDPVSFMRSVANEKISWTVGLPLMYKTILDHPERSNYDLSSLRYCIYAMAPMDEGSLRRAIKELGARFALGTGQTEMYPVTMVFKPEEQLQRFGNYWGVSSLLVDTAIMDDDGNLLSPGQVGEIVHRGGTVMQGYWKNEEAAEETRKYGWHHTGDLGMIDPDGQLLFVDRKKDMIKTGGENVASLKVERVILNEPRIANAAVVGLPHERWTEAVTAFVMPKPGTTISTEEVIEHCKQELAGFEIPKAVVWVDQFPMTATGKIQKNQLREKYSEYYEISSLEGYEMAE